MMVRDNASCAFSVTIDIKVRVMNYSREIRSPNAISAFTFPSDRKTFDESMEK